MRRSLVLLALLAGGSAAPLAAQVRLRPGVTIRSLEAAAARDSSDTAVLYDLALGYWSKKRWDDAERTLRLISRIEPRHAPALLALAHLHYARRPRLICTEPQGTAMALTESRCHP